MKWKITKSNFQPGDIRTRNLFAWRKTKVGRYWVWLETYQVTERWCVHEPIDVHDSPRDAWWHEVSREVLDYYY